MTRHIAAITGHFAAMAYSYNDAGTPVATSDQVAARGGRAAIFAMVFAYAIFAALWFPACDWLVDWLFQDPFQADIVDIFLDGIFIAFTALLLYRLMRRQAFEAETKALFRASEQRFRDIVDTTNGIVWEADAATFDFTFVSDKAVRLLGYSVEEWKTPGFWVEHLHPDDRKWAPEYCVSCTRRLEPHDFEYRFIARDGHTVWLHDIVTVVVENGAPRWLRGIMVDITERKQAERILSDDRKSMRDLLGSMIDGYWRTDIEGNLLDVNQTYCDLSGYSREELLTMRIHDLEAWESSLETGDHIEKIREKGYDRFVSMHRRKDGSVWHVEVTTTYRDIGAGEFFVFVRDIGEQKRNEEELARYRDHLEDLVSSRTQQLRAISSQLTMTEERERRALAQDLHDNLCQLLAVIKIRLTSFSADGAAASIPQIVDLVDQADRSARSITLQLCPPVLHSLGLVPALEWLADQMERDYGLTVHVYSGLCRSKLSHEVNAVLFRCIRELLINVAKHAETGDASVSCQCENHRLVLAVSDEGRGFDPIDCLGVVAEGHFGLSSIAERIGSIGGRMEVDSSPGNGATITLILPCPESEEGVCCDGPDYSL